MIHKTSGKIRFCVEIPDQKKGGKLTSHQVVYLRSFKRIDQSKGKLWINPTIETVTTLLKEHV